MRINLFTKEVLTALVFKSYTMTCLISSVNTPERNMLPVLHKQLHHSGSNVSEPVPPLHKLVSPTSAMTGATSASQKEFLDLALLNASSAPVAAFHVRVARPQVVTYKFTSCDNKPSTGTRFTCLLLGQKRGSHCEVAVRGSQQQVNQAMAK